VAGPSSTSSASWFDRFADFIASWVARAPFFVGCLLLVVLWTAGLPIAGPKNQLYHLLLNSPTTAITFLLLALLQNTQARFEHAQNARWEAIFDHLGIEDPVEDEGQIPD
jgi:low affinity Fe/Cu permease